MPTADIPGLPIAYVAMLAMLIVPQFVLIHPYLHLLIMGPLLVWIGCQRSLLESLKAPGESQVRSGHKPPSRQRRRAGGLHQCWRASV